MKTRVFKTKGGNLAVLRSNYETFFMTPTGGLLRPMPVSEWDWLTGGTAQIASNRVAKMADSVNLAGWLPLVPEEELAFLGDRPDGSYCNAAYANVHGRIVASRWVSADDRCFPWWEGEQVTEEHYRIL